MDWGDFLLEFAFGLTSSLITYVSKVEWHIFILGSIVSPGPNISTTPLRQWGFRQCLPFSWTPLRGKHPIAVVGVVDTFGLGHLGM